MPHHQPAPGIASCLEPGRPRPAAAQPPTPAPATPGRREPPRRIRGPLRHKSRLEVFPHCGNILSIVWKNREKVFHCVENFRSRALPRRQAAPHLILSAREIGDFPMKAFVGITDRDWFDPLSHRPSQMKSIHNATMQGLVPFCGLKIGEWAVGFHRHKPTPRFQSAGRA